MSLRMRELLMRSLDDLRHEPTEKRIRATIGDGIVVDSTRALLVWEPRRIVPSYAVPVEDVRAELVPSAVPRPPLPGAASPAGVLLHPGIPFAAPSADGEALDIRLGGETREAAAFRPADADLSGYAVLDFRAFDAWYAEDEQVVGHPRDPFHRIDIHQSSRNVRIELDGQVLAESSQPLLLFETGLPTRFYMQADDLRVPSRSNDRRTYCAYKGEASYLTLELEGGPRDDLVWSYQSPLRDAAVLEGRIAFFDEKVDVVLDGERRDRPRTQFSDAITDEAGV